MLKTLIKLVKKIIMAGFLLYGYNLIAAPINLIIPINVITILLVSLFEIPAILSLIVIMLVAF